jgi:hypothetical protein
LQTGIYKRKGKYYGKFLVYKIQEMKNSIKLHEPLLLVFYKDVDKSIDVLTTPLKNRPALLKKLNSEMFVDVEGIVINRLEVKKVEASD